MTDLTIEISTKDLAQLVKPIIPLANQDRMLPILNCVRLEARGKYLTASATDRFRVGIARTELATPPPSGLDILVGLTELRSLLSVFKSDAKVERTVTMTVQGDRLKVEQAFGFGFMDASMAFPLTSGEYPNLTHLFNADNLADPVPVVGVNAALLTDFRHAPRGGEPLIVRSAKVGKPLIVTAGDHFVGAIMPVRVDDEYEAERLGDWTATLAEKPKSVRKSRAKAGAAA